MNTLNPEKIERPHPWPEPPGEENKEQVFCMRCRYLFEWPKRNICECEYPDNVVTNWYGPDARKHEPSFLNKNNDCPWYEKKKE